MIECIGKIVERIVDDIQDRSGIGNEWDGIDDPIQEEIKDEWADIVGEEVDAELAKHDHIIECAVDFVMATSPDDMSKAHLALEAAVEPFRPDRA